MNGGTVVGPLGTPPPSSIFLHRNWGRFSSRLPIIDYWHKAVRQRQAIRTKVYHLSMLTCAKVTNKRVEGLEATCLSGNETRLPAVISPRCHRDDPLLPGGALIGQVFGLGGDVLITLPEDRLFEEVGQLVLSTTHLQTVIEDFGARQRARRVLKVRQSHSSRSR